MIAVREEQKDKGKVYPLNGVEQLVLNQRLGDMAWEGKERIWIREGRTQDPWLHTTPTIS